MSQELNSCETFRLPADREKKLRLGDFRLLEYPGHLKLQNLYLYQHLKDKTFLKNCKGLIYLIDSSVFSDDYCHSVADQMFAILHYTESIPGGVDILVACNKSEAFTAKPIFKIKEMLIQEINRIKVLKLKSLNQVDFSQDDESVFTENDDFTFDQLEGNFDFVAGSVKGGKVENWENWINERGVN